MSHREILVRSSGMVNKERRGILSIVKSVYTDKFFGVSLPPVENGFVRMDVHKGYHYFEYIDENTTRYVSVFNADP
jgi:hypothetical protein